MKKRYVTAWFGLFFYCSVFAKAETTYTINIAESVQTPLQRATTEAYFSKLYDPANIRPSFQYFPSRRGLKLVNEGELDAEAGRTRLVAKQYPNLYLVPEPVMQIKSGLFCRSKSNCQPSKSLSISHLSGFQAAALYCTEQGFNCAEVSNIVNLSKALDRGLSDAVLSGQHEAAQILCETQQNVFYYRDVSPLRLDIYHLVHVKHLSLVPQLMQTIKSIGQLSMYPGRDWKEPYTKCGKNIVELQPPFDNWEKN